MDFRADFQVVLDDALTHLEQLRNKAEEIYKGYNEDTDAEWDAAYQIFRDLQKAHEELSLTKRGIENGYI